ncbi:Monocarboxylate transporter 7 [Merluccius polli]|uniref:Monocarboxylate transporter 7 n=1 Tax=Merluccius polli TaxID=89951 RepID=A0AA47P1G6_MERPO|nr:Monocarboxylate transporter 7 [Merluccius polli]
MKGMVRGGGLHWALWCTPLCLMAAGGGRWQEPSSWWRCGTYGTIKSLGVFLQDLMKEFEESNSRVSWVVSICVFILTFTAPLSTVLSNRYGYRPVVMMGGVLISLGTVTSAFTNSIDQMYITIGVVSGIYHTYLAVPRPGLLPHLPAHRHHTWRSTSPTAALFVTSVASTGESFAVFTFAPAFTALKKQIGWRYCLLLIGLIQMSVIGCGTLLRPIIIQPTVDLATKQEDSSERRSLSTKGDYELDNEQTKTSLGSEDSGITSLYASCNELRVADAAMAPTTTDPQAAVDSLMEGEQGPLPPAPPVTLKHTEAHRPPRPKLLDFSVLRDGAFICYSLFGLFATLGFFAPQLYIIELSKSHGVAGDMASYMLSAMAVAEVFGRLSVGPAGKGEVWVLLACVVLLCLVLVAFTLVREFWGLLACCALYGFFLGTVASTHIPMLAEEEVNGIFGGVYVFIQSFAGLAGPPLGGWLVDVTHNYGSAFYSCAVGMGLGAACLALVGPTKSSLWRSGGREPGTTDTR